MLGKSENFKWVLSLKVLKIEKNFFNANLFQITQNVMQNLQHCRNFM